MKDSSQACGRNLARCQEHGPQGRPRRPEGGIQPLFGAGEEEREHEGARGPLPLSLAPAAAWRRRQPSPASLRCKCGPSAPRFLPPFKERAPGSPPRPAPPPPEAWGSRSAPPPSTPASRQLPFPPCPTGALSWKPLFFSLSAVRLSANGRPATPVRCGGDPSSSLRSGSENTAS